MKIGDRLMSTFETIREKIICILRESDKPLSVDDLILILNLNPREKTKLYDHIMHAAKTMKAKTNGKEEIVMIPPRCLKCGYIFKKLEKARKPSRCPKCKNENIGPPLFLIRKKC